jgi:hypothetical protein
MERYHVKQISAIHVWITIQQTIVAENIEEQK